MREIKKMGVRLKREGKRREKWGQKGRGGRGSMEIKKNICI